MWKWVRGAEVSTASPIWSSLQPDGDGECVNLWEADPKKLNDANCTVKLAYVCQLYDF